MSACTTGDTSTQPIFSSVNNGASPNLINLPKLSSKRLVQSVSSQTSTRITLCNNVSTQTDPMCTESVFSVSNMNVQNPVPLIKCVFKCKDAILLLDTGSSISILDKGFFNVIKQNINYKHLASSVQIKTLNSVVSFSACVEISLKIDGSFFKHPFFIVDLTDNSNFNGILGNDFIIKISL